MENLGKENLTPVRKCCFESNTVNFAYKILLVYQMNDEHTSPYFNSYF